MLKKQGDEMLEATTPAERQYARDRLAKAFVGSGLLFASASDASGSFNQVVLYDTASGRFYFTGSYGGGGGTSGTAPAPPPPPAAPLQVIGFWQVWIG